MKTYEPGPGESIHTACINAIALSKEHQTIVHFDFNDIKMVAKPEDKIESLVEQYHGESERRHQAYLASPEYKRQEEEDAQREHERESKLTAMLVGAPEHLTLIDSDSWRKSCDANKDGYGGAVITYAERWARLMEWRIAKGENLSDIADECSHLADSEGITGFMYGCAVGILSKVWKHGEELRRWHNLKSQIRDEGEKANESGGVLNPAMLVIGQ